MARKAANGNNDWRGKTHEIIWEDSFLTGAKKWVEGSNLSVSEAIERVVADGVSLRVRHSDHYDSYTFSISYPKDYKDQNGHTYWFYWGELDNGIRLAAWLHQEHIPNNPGRVGRLDRQTSW